MLVQLVFTSVATQACETVSEAILKQGRLHNAQRGLTGVLCYGYGAYMQAIEGERSAVNALYARILQDARHQQVELLHFEAVDERSFYNWPLGAVNLERLNQSAILKYTSQWPFNGRAWTGRSAMAFLKDVAASASVLAK